jgi:hypothetical protein
VLQTLHLLRLISSGLKTASDQDPDRRGIDLKEDPMKRALSAYAFQLSTGTGGPRKPGSTASSIDCRHHEVTGGRSRIKRVGSVFAMDRASPISGMTP